MAGTRNAYDTLQKLADDFEADMRVAMYELASALPSDAREQLWPFFNDVRDQHRANVRELRADLDLLTDEATQ